MKKLLFVTLVLLLCTALVVLDMSPRLVAACIGFAVLGFVMLYVAWLLGKDEPFFDGVYDDDEQND